MARRSALLLALLAPAVGAEDAGTFCSADANRPTYAYLTYTERGQQKREPAVLASFGAVPGTGGKEGVVRVVEAEPVDGCTPSTPRDVGVLAERGNCTYLDKALAAAAVHAPLLVVASNYTLPAWHGGAWSMGCASVSQVAPGRSNISLVAVMVPQDAGERLRLALAATNLTASVSLLELPFIDGSAFVLLALALATLALGSAWSCFDDYDACVRRIDAAQRRRRVRLARRLAAGASSVQGVAADASDEDEDGEDGDEGAVSFEVTPRAAAGFIVVASTVLVILYFLISDVMYTVVLSFFALAATTAFAAFLRFFVCNVLMERTIGVADRFVWNEVPAASRPKSHAEAAVPSEDHGGGSCDDMANTSEQDGLLSTASRSEARPAEDTPVIPKLLVWARAAVGPAGISLMDAGSAATAICTTAAWLSCRAAVLEHSDETGGLAPEYASNSTLRLKETLAWLLQDMLGVAFMAHVLRGIRLPNLKVAFILLPCCFAYDVFWVFLQPLLLGGRSVMVSVATGQGHGASHHSSGALPMLLSVPRLHSPLGGYSLLGYGDVVLPGLLMAFTLRRDLWARLRFAAERRFGDEARMEGGRRLAEVSVDVPPHEVLLRLLAAQGAADPVLGRSVPQHSPSTYAVPCMCAYVVGLALTFVALKLNVGGQRGQPALLYLVPCSLGTVALAAKLRGEWRGLWSGDAARGITIRVRGTASANVV